MSVVCAETPPVREQPAEDTLAWIWEQLQYLSDEYWHRVLQPRQWVWLAADCPFCRRLRENGMGEVECPICSQIRRSRKADRKVRQ